MDGTQGGKYLLIFRQVDQSKSQIVGMMSGFFLVLGIACGIAFTFVEPHIVNFFGQIFA
jgi:hypothetical protein